MLNKRDICSEAGTHVGVTRNATRNATSAARAQRKYAAARAALVPSRHCHCANIKHHNLEITPGCLLTLSLKLFAHIFLFAIDINRHVEIILVCDFLFFLHYNHISN